MEPGGRLVENVECVTGVALGEFTRQLDPLRFAPRESGRGLAEANIGQPNVHQCLQFAVDGRYGLKERQRVFHRQIQHLRDVEILEFDLQCFPVVALALADIAGHIDIGKKMHFDFCDPVALTGLAAPAADVKTEATGLVAP